MSFLEELRRLRVAPPAVWLLFIGDYREGKIDLHLFFEGRDDQSFYLPFIRQRWAERSKIYCYICRGKDEVIGLIPRIKGALDVEWRALFFIDKDIDEFCGDHSHQTDRYLYETDLYSIENYITQRETLAVLWTDLLCQAPADERLTGWLSAYDTAYQSFADQMRSVMGWVIQLRRTGFRITLNDVKMERVIGCDEQFACMLRPAWDEYMLASSNSRGPDYRNANSASVEEELKAVEPRRFIRGKFDLWFFVMFVRRSLAVITERAAGAHRIACSVSITIGTAIEILGPRIAPPVTLTNFLNNVLPV